jgi:hypothetical protein
MEALVFLGCGGNLSEWTNGIADILVKDGITTTPVEHLKKQFYFVETTGNRIDLVLIYDEDCICVSKLVFWRLRFGDCMWLSDYVENCRKQHLTVDDGFYKNQHYTPLSHRHDQPPQITTKKVVFEEDSPRRSKRLAKKRKIN